MISINDGSKLPLRSGQEETNAAADIWCCITRKEWCFFFWKLLVKPGRLLMQLWTLVRRSGWQRRTLAPLQQSAVKQLAVSILIIKVLLQPISLGHAHDPS